MTPIHAGRKFAGFPLDPLLNVYSLSLDRTKEKAHTIVLYRANTR